MFAQRLVAQLSMSALMSPAHLTVSDVAKFTPQRVRCIVLERQATFGADASAHLSQQSECEQRHRRLGLNAQETSGLGPLSHAAQRGLALHPTLRGNTPTRATEVIHAWTRARRQIGRHPTRGYPAKRRWVESCEHMAQQAREMPAPRHGCIGERESDLLALRVKTPDLDSARDHLVHCQHNRALPEGC